MLPSAWNNGKGVGAIFPVLPEHVPNLFDNSRDVFVKFTKLTGLKNGSVIVFYVSREKVLIGEGKIREVEKSDPETAWSRYKERIFLDKEEYDSYIKISPIGKEEMRELTVFTLEKTKKYRKPVDSIYTVTPSGRSVTQKMIDKIRQLSDASL